MKDLEHYFELRVEFNLTLVCEHALQACIGCHSLTSVSQFSLPTFSHSVSFALPYKVYWRYQPYTYSFASPVAGALASRKGSKSE